MGSAKKQEKWINHVYLTCMVFGSFYVIAILFGAPVLSDVISTAFFSLWMTVIIAGPLCYIGCSSPSSLVNLFLLQRPTNLAQSRVMGSSVGCVIGAWLGVFVIPLDWDRWWQEFPIPCCFGSAILSVAGFLGHSFLSLTQRRDKIV